MGAVGVTGTSAANALAAEADVILAVGTRLQDFTTGSRALFSGRIIGLNVQPFDAGKHGALPLVADARAGLDILNVNLGTRVAPAEWTAKAGRLRDEWLVAADAAMRPANAALPSDAQVIGAVARSRGEEAVIVCAAGGLPGELHKLWRAAGPGGYHLEYGFSTMGYEIAAGVGVKLARPGADVVVMVGDGSYMMMNSEIVTAVMLGLDLTIVVLDNGGFGCINRLQHATGGAGFNNLYRDTRHVVLPGIDFAAHAAAMGADARKLGSLADLEAALAAPRSAGRPSVLVIDTDPLATTEAGGHWWDVAVPEVSARPEVGAARTAYEAALARRRDG
jgi:3D-(3,5/4)-trihydroxycyclohexane-1,2-dione acylhydrolase (decyclizing)